MHTFTIFLFFFFNDTATTEIYTLSLHDALPISELFSRTPLATLKAFLTFHYLSSHAPYLPKRFDQARFAFRSEEHTSELQSQSNLVCRLLLEKKKNYKTCTDHLNRITYC